MHLSDKAVRNTKPAEKTYRLKDGDGLYLQVDPKGGKYWRLRYFHLGKEKMLALGTYPDNSLELMKLAQRAGASAALANIVEGNPSSVVVLLHMQTNNGPAIAPVVVASPRSQRIADKVIVSDPLHKGFRPGHLPPELLVRRYLGGGKSSRRQIQRIDSSWVHSRDSDAHHSILRAKRVAIIGCGSLGSSIAAQLAATGIGEFLFVDGEDLAWENIGRHYLGAGYVGKNKAQALAEALKKD